MPNAKRANLNCMCSSPRFQVCQRGKLEIAMMLLILKCLTEVYVDLLNAW